MTNTNQKTDCYPMFGIGAINCPYDVKIEGKTTKIVDTFDRVDPGYTVIPVGSFGSLIVQNVVFNFNGMVCLVIHNCSDSLVEIKQGEFLANVIVADLRKMRYTGPE